MRLRDARWHVAAVIASVGIGIAGVAAPALGADRALELVTKPGDTPDVKIGAGLSTPDGNVVCYSAESTTAGTPSNGQVFADDGYCATRTSSGWDNRWVTGPAPRIVGGWFGSQIYHVSDDGRRVVFASDAGIFPDYRGTPGDPDGGTVSSYIHEAGETRWLTPSPEPIKEELIPQAPLSERAPLAVSADFSHGIFVSMIRLVPEDQNATTDVYEWTPSGIRLVTRDDTGAAVGGVAPVGLEWGEQRLAQPGAISEDGSRVFFERTTGFGEEPLAGGPMQVKNVYMREGDELTHISRRAGAGPHDEVYFAGAYANGTVVYLRTAEQLTGEAKAPGTAIYRYDTESRAMSLVVDDQAQLLAATDDGETIVYTRGADMQLHVLRGADDWTVGNFFAGADDVSLLDSGASTRSDKRALRLTPDGRTLVFASYNTFVPGDDTGFRQQVYRWTAAAGVRRISAASDGSPAQDEATLGNFASSFPGRIRYTDTRGFRVNPNLGRAVSDDGRYVFFDSVAPLVAEDVNGKVDVYEWRDGVLSLVSPGTQRDHAFFHDNSADGQTAFFTTNSSLIPELDRNSSRDLYAARVGGGFPLPPVPPRCVEDGCQPPPTPPPAMPRGNSDAFQGPGDTLDPAPRTPRITVVRITSRQRRRFARTGSIVLSARVNVRGLVTATATARIRRRKVRVAQTARAARGDNTTVRIPLTLSRRAGNVLRERGRLRVTLSIAYSETDAPARRVVVLRA